MGPHKIEVFVLYAPAFLRVFFCKFWPHDGPLRRKLVANRKIKMKYYIVVPDVVYI
jgi:hypothetical protein